jgi:hypothetical protein
MSDSQQVEGRFSRAARYLLLHYRGCVWYSTVCMVRKLEDMDYHSRPGYCGTWIGTPPCMRGSSAGGDYHMGWEVWKQARGRGRGRPGCGSSMHLHITAQRTLLPAYVCMYVCIYSTYLPHAVPQQGSRSIRLGSRCRLWLGGGNMFSLCLSTQYVLAFIDHSVVSE